MSTKTVRETKVAFFVAAVAVALTASGFDSYTASPLAIAGNENEGFLAKVSTEAAPPGRTAQLRNASPAWAERGVMTMHT